VDLHKGRIGVHSEGEGMGSKFYFEIPISRVVRKSREDVSPSVSEEIRPQRESVDIGSLPPSLIQHRHSMQGRTKVFEEALINAQSPLSMNAQTRRSRNSVFSGRTFTDHYFDRHRSASLKSSVWTLDLLQGTDAGKGTDSARQHMDDNALGSIALRDIGGENRRLSQETIASIWRPRLLIVDDSRLNRKMMCRVLASRCDVCDEAEDGLDAVKMVEQAMKNDTSYDIILMDYMMPIMDGPTATKEIIALGYTGTIVGVTGNALPEDINTFLSHGASQVIVKPFDVQAFDDIVQGISLIHYLYFVCYFSGLDGI